jgi:hypothetical protein
VSGRKTIGFLWVLQSVVFLPRSGFGFSFSWKWSAGYSDGGDMMKLEWLGAVVNFSLVVFWFLFLLLLAGT